MPIFKRCKHFYQDTRGAIIILWALLLPAILGFIGLGVETAYWYMNERDLQSTTDAAAVAAAYKINTSGSVTTAAQTEITRNGYTVSTSPSPSIGNVSVTVANPPTSGTYSGNSNAVKVTVTQPQDIGIASLFLTSASVSTTATALKQSSGEACLLALNSSASGAIDLSGGAQVNMSTCVAAANSTSSSAIDVTGGADLTVTNVHTPGNYSVSGTGSSIVNSSPNVTGGSAVTNPYASYTNPTYSGCDYSGHTQIDGSVTLSEGVFCGDLTFKNGSNVTLNPGTYVIKGGNLTFKEAITGTGVTFVLTGDPSSTTGTVSVNAGASLNLTAPTAADTTGSITGNYAGMVFYQDQNAPTGANNNFNGGSTMSITGAMYFKNQEVTFNGGSSTTSTCLKIVADTIKITGNANMTTSCPTTVPDIDMPGGTVQLME